MSKNKTIHSTSFLAVEGKDEKNFFEALLTYLSIPDVQVEDVGGKDKFKKELFAWSFVENFMKINKLAFIRDAEDKKADSGFLSICDALKSLEVPQPNSIDTVFNQNNKKVGIFIMPNNLNEGMLENLCLESISSDPIEKCINDFINCSAEYLDSSNHLKYNEPKSRVQIYLASKTPIVNSLGLGAQKGYWNFKHQCFTKISDFLRNVFQ
jgi:hypothetical protein